MDIWSALIGTFSFRITKFLLIFSIVFGCASVTEKYIIKQRLLAVTIVGAIIVTAAIYDLIKFVDWEYYRYTFQSLPNQAIILRYIFSLLWRVVVLAVGIRLLCLDNQARKAAIVLSWMQIITIFWKHPVVVFEHLSLQVQQQTMPGSTQLINPWQPWLAFLVFSIFDIMVAIFIIYFFSRPLIKKNFVLK